MQARRDPTERLEDYLSDECKHMINTMLKAGRDEYGFTNNQLRYQSLTGESISYMLWAMNGGAKAAYSVGNLERRNGHADVVRYRVEEYAELTGQDGTDWAQWVVRRFKSYVDDIIDEKLRNFR